MTPTFLLLVSFVSDFAITVGTILMGAMLEGQAVTLPNRAVIILALISGVVVAARRAQALIQPSSTEKPPDLETMVAKMVAALKPVTPTRVPLPEDAPPPKPVKDSS